jgi:hypothetical protein
MCNPMALIGLVQSAVSFAASSQDYNARAAQWKQNYVNSLAAGREEQKQLSLRMTQEQDATVQKLHQNNLEGAEITAEAEVSGGASGLSGISLDNILTGINRKVQDKNNADKINYANTAAQLTAELKATNTKIENRINSVQRPTSPNPLGYALQGIGGALGSMSKGK